MLKTKLILERLDREGRLLERRCQPAKSFTRSFIELLYISHAQIQAASPYSMTDIDLLPRDVDSQGAGRYAKHNLRIGASPGLSPTRCEPGIDSVGYSYRVKILGCDLGIEVGVGTTAVTPTDRRLEQRIGHGRRPPDGAPAVFESYTTGDDNNSAPIYGTDRWTASAFMPAESHRITSVRVKIWKAAGDTPGNVTVLIQGPDAADDPRPSGVTLASGTILEAAIPVDTPGDWVECTLATPVDLYAGHQYVIIVQALTGNSTNDVKWRTTDAPTYKRCSADTPSYFLYSMNAGVDWSTNPAYCFMFEDKGQSVGEFEYGGCELANILLTGLAPHDGEFTIRRYFTNHCGQAVTVNEAGMTAAGTRYTTGYAWPFLIAHDIVAPGVAVADGELLRATYVPQITV
ncbi:hypothetical protein ES703_86160 [subsurface metagenome]